MTFSVISLDLVQDNFLVVAIANGDKGNLYQIDLRSGAMNPLLTTTTFRPEAVAFDPVEKIVYWTDVEQQMIVKTRVDGNQRNSMPILNDSTGTSFKQHESGTAAINYYNLLHFFVTHV